MTPDQQGEEVYRGVLIDLDMSYKAHVHGDITVHETWTMDDKRPCLVLIPTFRRIDQRITPCICRLDHAFMWGEHTGDPEVCVHNAVQFCKDLGLNPWNKANVLRVTDLVRKHLPDMIKLGPMPPYLHRVVADAVLIDPRTGKSYEREITDDVH